MAKLKTNATPQPEKRLGSFSIAIWEDSPQTPILQEKLQSLKNAPPVILLKKGAPLPEVNGYLLFLAPNMAATPGLVITAAQNLRQAPATDTLGIINFTPAKAPMGKRFRQGLYDLTVQLLSPLKSSEAGLIGTVIHSNLLPLVHESGYDPGSLQDLHLLRLEGLKDEPLSISQTYPEISVISQVAKVKWTALKARWQYYLVQPIKTGLLKGGLENGNAPLYRFLFAAIALLALFLMPILSQQFGITWDENLHNKYGYDMVKYYSSFGRDTTCFTSHPHFPYYGEHFNLYTATLHTWFPSWDEFGTRHFLNALYGFLAILYIGLIGRELGSWRTALLALLFALFNPQLFGHSMNNPTDIPFATGYTIALFYFIRLLKQLPDFKVGTALLGAWGIGMALGSRAGALVLFAYLGLGLGIHWIYTLRKNKAAFSLKSLLPYVKAGLLSGGVGYLIGIVFWPYALSHPFSGPLTALKRSTNPDFFTVNHELFEGVRDYMGYAPWYYIPKFMVIQTPLVSLLGAVLLLAGLFWLLRKSQAAGILLLGFAVLFPIVYGELQDMYYYNGWRHFLFTYTGFIALSAVGWEFVLSRISQRWLNLGVLVIALLGAILPATWMLKNHPHQYTYFNELVGGVNGAYGNYEIDYYANCMRPAAEWLSKNEDLKSRKVKVAINMEPLAAQYYFNKMGDSVEVVWVREYEKYKQDWDYFFFSPRTMSREQLTNGSYPPKGTIHEIKADEAKLVAIVKAENQFMHQGYTLYQENLADSALQYFRKAIQYDPMNEEAYRMAGMCLLKLKQSAEAKKMMEESIELYPENPYGWYQKGLVAAEAEKSEEALECFKKSATYKINYFDPQLQAGYLLLSLQRYQEAQQILEKAIKYGGATQEGYLYLGIAYFYNQQNQKAIDYLETALRINPRLKMAYEYLAEAYSRIGDKQRAAYLRQQGAALRE